jgi:hypothetical protein
MPMAIYNKKRSSLHNHWVLLGFMAFEDKPVSKTDIMDNTGMTVSMVISLLKRIQGGDIPGLVLTKTNLKYNIDDWGGFLSKKQCIDFYKALI